MTTFIDTNFITALVNERDELHAKALDLSERFEGQKFLLTDAILLESGNALAKRFRTEVIDIIDQFQNSADVEIVRLDPEIFEAGFNLFKQHKDKTWGLVDCISFVVMNERGITEALTFDQHFVQAGFRALMRD